MDKLFIKTTLEFIKSPLHGPYIMVTSELREIFSSAMSRLGVGIGLGPQNEDSMSIVCGEPDRRPDEEDEMEETRVSPGGGLLPAAAPRDPASTLRSISAPKLDEVAEARLRAASRSIKSSLLAPGPRFSRLASIIRKL